MSRPPYNREYYSTGSCFRAGTKIATNSGVAMIENLKEWDRVLTLAEPEQYGEVSNETVMHRIEVALIGFSKLFRTPIVLMLILPYQMRKPLLLLLLTSFLQPPAFALSIHKLRCERIHGEKLAT